MTTYLSALTLIAGAILYFLGWMYLYYYLAFFGFSIFEIDVPFHYYFIYAFAVLDNALIFSSTGATVFVMSVFLYVSIRNAVPSKSIYVSDFENGLFKIIRPWRLDSRAIFALSWIAALCAVFVYAHQVARSSALDEGKIKYSENSGSIILFNKASSEEIGSKFDERSMFLVDKFLIPKGPDDATRYLVKLIFATSDSYFLLLRDKNIKNSTSLSIRVQKSDVIFLGTYLDSPHANGG